MKDVTVTLDLRESGFVQRPIEDVFAYLSDFPRAKEWRAEVVESSMSTPQMHSGTQLRDVVIVLGRRIETRSRVVDFERPHRWTFESLEGPLPVSGAYDLVAISANRTEFTYRLRVHLPGLWALAAPVLRWSGARMLRAALTRLREVMESSAAVGGGRTGWRARRRS